MDTVGLDTAAPIAVDMQLEHAVTQVVRVAMLVEPAEVQHQQLAADSVAARAVDSAAIMEAALVAVAMAVADTVNF
jgi:acyl-coenzyme A thioesterase PaaI-like protein